MSVCSLILTTLLVLEKKVRTQSAALGKVGKICSSLGCPLYPSQDHTLLPILFFAVTAIALVLFLAVVQRNVTCLLNTVRCDSEHFHVNQNHLFQLFRPQLGCHMEQ